MDQLATRLVRGLRGWLGCGILRGFANAASLVTSANASCVYQGLTQVGQWYVSMFWPVATDSLPGDALAEMGNNDVYDAFVKNFSIYSAQTVAQAANSFTPDLSLLDRMLSSLDIH